LIILKQFNCLTLSHPAGFRNFCARTNWWHVALHAHSSGTKSSRKLFKGSKDVASLLAYA